MNLQEISRAITQHVAVTPERGSSPKAYGYDVPKFLRMVRWGLGIMLLGVLLGILGKKIIFVEVLSGIGALIAIIGLAFTLWPFFSAILPESSPRSPRVEPDTSASNGATRKVFGEGQPDQAMSVTDRTTAVLVDARPSAPGVKSRDEEPATEAGPGRPPGTDEMKS